MFAAYSKIREGKESFFGNEKEKASLKIDGKH